MNNGQAGPVSGDTPSVPGPKPRLPTLQVIMNGDALRRIVTIRNPHGLHMRFSAHFAQLAAQFQSSVIVRHKDRIANGKSLIELITLVAEPGHQVILEVSGEDAGDALRVLSKALALPFIAEEKDAGPPPKG